MKRHFDWDPRKAVLNQQKHRVSFLEAVTIFRDPCILSKYDDTHSETEDRWLVLGESERFRLLVVVLVIVEQFEDIEFIRIVSARRATRRETQTYRSRRPL